MNSSIILTAVFCIATVKLLPLSCCPILSSVFSLPMSVYFTSSSFRCSAWPLSSGEVVDSTGAGDAFIGGFLGGLIWGLNDEASKSTVLRLHNDDDHNTTSLSIASVLWCIIALSSNPLLYLTVWYASYILFVCLRVRVCCLYAGVSEAGLNGGCAEAEASWSSAGAAHYGDTHRHTTE
jgi:hypothetical protein